MRLVNNRPLNERLFGWAGGGTGGEQVEWPVRSGTALLSRIPVDPGSKKEVGGRNLRKDFFGAILGPKNDMKILY